MALAISQRRTPSDSCCFTAEDRTFLNSIPGWLAQLSHATVHAPGQEFRNYKFLVASANDPPLLIMPFIQSILNFFRSCSDQSQQVDLSLLKGGISISHRLMLRQLCCRVNALCKPYPLILVINTGYFSASRTLDRLSLAASTFSEKEFQLMRESSFCLKNTAVSPPRKPALPITEIVHNAVNYSDGRVSQITFYQLSEETLATVKEEQDGAEIIASGSLAATLRASSPTLAFFPPGLLPLIATFLLYWKKT